MKLTGELDLDLARVRSIRAARPDVWLGVDANQGYSIGQLPALVRGLCEQRVLLLEQPLPRGREADLQGFDSLIPIAADESVLSLEELPRAVGRFDVVNIKLDKCGGLTEGLMMAEEARRLGLEVMVGTMIGTSLATAPAFILAQQCSIVDLDGPTFLVKDRSPSVVYRDGDLFAGDDVWGARERRRRMTSEKTWFGHPRGLTVLFLTNMWEQFSYYGMRALLVYYMTKQLLMAQGTSSLIYGIYTGCAYFTPLIGGIIADRCARQEARDHHRRQRDGARAFHDDRTSRCSTWRWRPSRSAMACSCPACRARSAISTSAEIRARAAPTTSTTSA